MINKNIDKKNLTRVLRLLDLYWIDKLHKKFLSWIKAQSVNEWFKISEALIKTYTRNKIVAKIANYKNHCKKSEEIQYVWAKKNILKLNR